MELEYESVLLVKKEVFLYMLPPRQSTRAYRAADWKLDAPAWTGRMKIVSKASKKSIFIKLEDIASGKLYAQCPVNEYPGIAIESVSDSSRYFVIRLVADDGRAMFVGIGFAERSDSFDFNVAIQDHFKHIEEAEKHQNAPQTALDLGLKEGQRLRLNINTRRSDATGEEVGNGGRSARSRPMPSLKLGMPLGGGSPIIQPPPPSSRTRPQARGTFPDSDSPVNASVTQQQHPFSNSDLLADIFASPVSSATSATAVAPPNVLSHQPNENSLI